MSDVEGRDGQAGEQFPQLSASLLAQLGVEVAERLVEEDDARLCHDGARQRDALLLAAAEGRGRPAFVAPELHETQCLRDALDDIGARHAPRLEWVGDVVEHGHVRPDGVGLEHHADPALVGRDGLGALSITAPHDRVADGDGAGVRRLEPGDTAQQCRLAATARSEQSSDRAVGHVQAHVVERRDQTFRRDEGLAHLVDPDLHA